ncbi:Sec1-like protein [Corchorus olitorius]|uniref:Sec1-like protein n=1 Tax=Corchorus olitorius TaxID=93759 RepID=A0A1R3H4X9_9ROSI|nr:Sec1-like protein [Corchorus olitorius]
MSYAFKMTDITLEGVSCKELQTVENPIIKAFTSLLSVNAVVEDIDRKRQPLPFIDAIYFIQPSRQNISVLLSDMSRKKSVYKRSPISVEFVEYIHKDSTAFPRITMKEMNLEYFAIESQSFITGNERVFEDLFGVEENTSQSDSNLSVMAGRIASVFASLKEFPFVRYRAAKSIDATTPTTVSDLIPTKLAARVWNSLMRYKETVPNFPQTETCELLILDRSIDQISPVIHEWFYDAMCHDLLNMEGNKYVQEVPGKNGGPPVKKEVILEEHDPIWLEIRHSHIAEANERLHDKMTNFIAQYKATQHCGTRFGTDLSTRELQKIVQVLPQYSEEIDKLSLHIEIAGKINKIIRDMRLKELGQLEQDLTFGVAGMKDDATNENKLRLLMITAAIYPEEFDGEKGLNLMKLAKLSAEDMNAVYNMILLGGSPNTKKSFSGIFSLNFDFRKRTHGARKECTDVEQRWQLSRFYPVIEELIEKLAKGELSKKEYPCLNDPVTSSDSSPASARSMRTRPTWARHRDYTGDSVPRHGSSDSRKMGRRIFVFIVGGATRSELRVCHKLTNELKREVVLGSSSLDDPSHFLLVTSILLISFYL